MECREDDRGGEAKREEEGQAEGGLGESCEEFAGHGLWPQQRCDVVEGDDEEDRAEEDESCEECGVHDRWRDWFTGDPFPEDKDDVAAVGDGYG